MAAYNFFPEKISLKTEWEIVIFSKQKLREFFTNRPTCTKRNIKESYSGRRKMRPDWNLDLQKGIRSTRSGKYVGKYKNLKDN